MPANILVVDDELGQRELLIEMLTLEGYSVTSAADGIQAEALLDEFLSDLVLLDVKLPFRNGFDICRRLKQRSETRLIPIILVTGLTDSQDRLRGIEAGADDFLTKPFDRAELQARVRSLIQRKEYTDELDRADRVVMDMGNRVEAKDPRGVGHCARISAYSTLLGEALEISPEEIRALRIAGSVHDIGKIGVSDAILLKKGPLAEEEWAVMHRHPIVGERICGPLRSFHSVLPIIRSHHEKQDGSGYPDGLHGDQVPELARILQIADVFDALTTERPWKAAMSCDDALLQMKMEVDRGWWDPALFDVFAALARRERLPWSTAFLESLS